MPQIKKAYKALAKKYHPDKNRNAQQSDVNEFTKIQEAYEKLKRKYER